MGERVCGGVQVNATMNRTSSKKDRYGGGSVMVWGGITRNTKTDIITVQGTLIAAGYCAQIIQPVIVPFVCQRPGVIIQKDNARLQDT